MTGRADLLFVGGRRWRGVTDAPPADVLAVRDGTIVAVDGDAVALRGPDTEVVDLHGGTLLPAFRDGHIHPLDGGAETLDCDLVDAADVNEALARLAAHAAADEDEGWLLGYGYPPEILPQGIGRADVLDRVVGDRPVALWSSDHHMVWVNSRALEIAGITAATEDPPRGTVVRDPDGRPIGTLLEEAERLLTEHLPPRGVEKEMRGLEVGLDRMTAAGIAWAQDAWTTPARMAAYQRVADDGRLRVDLDLAFKVEVDDWREQVARFEDARTDARAGERRRLAAGVPGGRLTATTAKFFVDGVIEGGTGALLEPYCDAPHDHGILNWELDELTEAAVVLDEAGFQLHLHAIGDAGIRTALDAIAAVGERNGPRDRRPVIAHTHLVHPDDLPRFRELGVIANFEPLWAQPNEVMTDLTEPRLGPVRSTWQYPIGTLLRGGARVSFGSDWPVSSIVPMEGIAVAVTRQTPAGEPPGGWLPDERIGLGDAIAAYTTGTAFQAHDEPGTGTLEVGSRADLVALDADLCRVGGSDLAQVGVTGTWLRGRETHRVA